MSARSPTLVVALRLLSLAIIGLGLAAPVLGQEVAWGIWPATYLSPVWRWLLALVAAVLIVWGDLLRLSPHFDAWLGSPRARLLLAAAAAVPFYLYRIVHTRWGDAFMLVNSIPHPDVRYTYTWQAPLDVFIHSRTFALGHRLFGWIDAMPAYWLLSTVAGVLFVWVLLGAAAWLGRDRTEQILLVGLVLSLGTVQLFFGYVENYSYMAVGVLLYLWLGLRTLRGEVRPRWPAVVLALTHAFHPSTLILAPSVLYLAWAAPACVNASDSLSTAAGIHLSRPHGTRAGRTASTVYVRNVLEVALPYVLIGAALLAFMALAGHGPGALLGAEYPGGGDRRWFVPLTATTSRWEHYTMFSMGHLLDILNQQLLVAPVIWPAFLLAIAAYRQSTAGEVRAWEGRRDRSFGFLLISALLYVLLIVTWNPDYGGQRDWDLFAPAAIPAAFLLAYTLPRILPAGRPLEAACWALIAAQAYHTLAWIYQNTLPWSWSQMQ